MVTAYGFSVISLVEKPKDVVVKGHLYTILDNPYFQLFFTQHKQLAHIMRIILRSQKIDDFDKSI